MYAIFTREDENSSWNFFGLNQNKLDDKWISKTMENMGWEIPHTKIFKYNDSVKFLKFVKHLSDCEKCHKIICEEDGLLKKVKIIREKSSFIGTADFNSSYSLNYYTQEQIDQYNANLAVLAQWNQDNPNPTEETPPPEFPYEWPEYFSGEVVDQDEEYEVLDSMQGNLIDIESAIANEQGE